ncbi:nucleotidyltransferase family protein [Vreelandella utahensis]|uniref:nucleotidyltransferase family protein n=1 Tax=Vreelandella halophila TaxID=86177 RepID=UPI0009856493|nr:nucleotidyltransferase family protein [Halomonas utahensis]
MPEARSPRDGPGGTGVIALVMAAGASRRFGDADKRVAALPDGRTLLAATVAGLYSGLSDVRVVIGKDDSPAALNLPGTVPVLRAPNAAHGMGSSIADAVNALEGERAAAVAICLGDMAWIKTTTLSGLARKATANGIVRPVHQGQPGHPVLFGHSFWPELARLSGDEGGRQIIQGHPSCCQLVSVDDPGTFADLDNPSQIRR